MNALLLAAEEHTEEVVHTGEAVIGDFMWIVPLMPFIAFFVILAVKVWAFVDALLRPAEAYVAAGKLTKPGWLAITGEWSWDAVILGLAVGVWIGGFDLIFACQDVAADRAA